MLFENWLWSHAIFRSPIDQLCDSFKGEHIKCFKLMCKSFASSSARKRISAKLRFFYCEAFCHSSISATPQRIWLWSFILGTHKKVLLHVLAHVWNIYLDSEISGESMCRLLHWGRYSIHYLQKTWPNGTLSHIFILCKNLNGYFYLTNSYETATKK